MSQSNHPNEELIKQLEDLKREINALRQSFDQELSERKSIEFDLQERLKELHCHNQISELMANPRLSLSDAIEQIVKIIPPSWQFPEIAQACVAVHGTIYQTPGFVRTRCSMLQDIKANGETVGYVEVCYPEDQLAGIEQFFLPEEAKLLFSIAVKIGNFVEQNEKDLTIRASEEKFKNLVESISEIVYEVTSQGTIKYLSPSVERILGYQPKELIGKSIFDILYPDDQPLLAKRLVSLAIEPDCLHEYRFLTKNGETRWMSKSTVTISEKDQEIARAGTLRDITEQKKSEEALIRSTRLYAVISQVNSAILHTKDKNKLLEEVCRVAVEYGKFRMAWIGVVDENSGKVVPFASAGHTADYLSIIKPISLADCPEGNGPTGTALRNGDHFVCNDIETDPHMAPWRKEALKRGYRSSIATPIKQSGKVVASFNLYSSVPYFFNPDEIKLLDEIAFDIAYALEAIDTEQERHLAEKEIYKFRTVMEQANYGSSISTPEGIITFVNPEFARMHGYTPEEIIGKHFSMFHTPEQGDEIRQTLDTIQAKGSVGGKETWRKRKDGSVFPSLINVSLISDASQTPQFLSMTIIDITEQKKREQLVEQSEKNLNYAQELGNMGSWELDLKTNKVRWSKNNYKLMEAPFDNDEVSNDYFFSLVHPDDMPLLENKLQEIKQTRQEVKFDLRLVMPSGAIKWTHDRVAPVFEGDNLVALRGANLDITEKKLVEEEIKQQNARLNAIVSAIPDLMFVLDSAGTNLEFYARNTDKLLAPAEHFIGTNVKDLFDAPTAELHIQKINECINSGKLVAYEYSVGDPKLPEFFEARLAPLEKNKVLTFIRDISDKKQKDIQIRKLSQAVEQSPVIVVVTGLDGVIEYVNPAFTDVTGYTYEEAIGKNPRILQSGKTDRVTYREMWNSISSGKQWQGEWMNRKKNGELFWESVVITPIQNEQNQITNYVAVKQDITQRKFAEKEILDLNASLESKIEERTTQLADSNIALKKEIEERKVVAEALEFKTNELENFFNVALDLLCIADTSGNFVRVNKAWESILGYSASDLEKRQFLEFVHPDDVQATLDAMAELSEQHPILNFTNRYLSKDGSYRFIEWRSSPSGQLIYAAARDITERIRSEEETQKARIEAEQANLAKSEFLSRMSHELRTPMNAILGFAQLLEMGQLNQAQRKGVDHILRGGKHLLDLINEVLDISRIESGRLSISPEPVRIHEVLEEMIDAVAPLAESRQIKINIVDSSTVYSFVKADRQRLKQVLLNLINNAIKYNKPQGNVNIVVEIVPTPEEPLSVRISVSDTGIGIREDDISKLFRPFERIGAEKTDTEGSGLGLAVVKKLVEAMSGNVGVESQFDIGSTFWIELPYSDSQLKSIHTLNNSGTDQTSSVEKNGTIICIEDNTSNIELIEQILESQRPNIRMVSSINGNDTVALSIMHKPKLILLDLNLPDIHGSEVIKMLQTNSETKHIPVIILSADAMPHQQKNLMSLGAKNYLTKPLDIIQFLEVIDHYIE